MNPTATALQCEDVSIDVPGRTLVRGLRFDLARGRVLAVLGRNGAGKSSLLHAIAGLRESTGVVRIDGRPLTQWRPRELAARLGLLPQLVDDPFPATALEAALVGRHPHIDFWSWETANDVDCARRALAMVDLGGYGNRDIGTLSGGERRRLAIATLLAQDPAIFLLDEPIHQLDPQHQVSVLQLFRGLADSGRTVVASLHDVGLAARFADQALLLHGNGRWAYGDCATVLDERSVGELYGIRVRELRWDGGRTFVAA